MIAYACAADLTKVAAELQQYTKQRRIVPLVAAGTAVVDEADVERVEDAVAAAMAKMKKTNAAKMKQNSTGVEAAAVKVGGRSMGDGAGEEAVEAAEQAVLVLGGGLTLNDIPAGSSVRQTFMTQVQTDVSNAMGGAHLFQPSRIEVVSIDGVALDRGSNCVGLAVQVRIIPDSSGCVWVLPSLFVLTELKRQLSLPGIQVGRAAIGIYAGAVTGSIDAAKSMELMMDAPNVLAQQKGAQGTGTRTTTAAASATSAATLAATGAADDLHEISQDLHEIYARFGKEVQRVVDYLETRDLGAARN
jgi:hypothetical protein